MRTDLQLSRSPPSHWLSPNHNGYSSLSGSEDQSCWIHSPSAGNPINLQEELFHGATLSSHLNIYSQPPWLSLLTNCASLFLTSSFISRLHPSFSSHHMSPAHLYSIFVPSYLRWSDSLSSPSSRRFFWDLRSSLWLQRNWLQRRSAVGEDTIHAVQKLFRLLCF